MARVDTGQYVAYTFYRVDPAWRRLPVEERAAGKDAFADVVESWADRMAGLRAYTCTGVRPACDFFLWKITDRYEDLGELGTELNGTPLADYATYYKGLAQLRLSRASDARQTFNALSAKRPTGYLAIAAVLGEADAAIALGDHKAALALYETLTADKTAINDQILLKQADAARALGDRAKTAEALVRIYYEYPLTDAAVVVTRAPLSPWCWPVVV